MTAPVASMTVPTRSPLVDCPYPSWQKADSAAAMENASSRFGRENRLQFINQFLPTCMFGRGQPRENEHGLAITDPLRARLLPFLLESYNLLLTAACCSLSTSLRE